MSEDLRAKYEARRPHCDDLVLHEPGMCVYCDCYPALQAERIQNRINFTGQSDASKAPCPATVRRPFLALNAWGGNRANGSIWPSRDELNDLFGPHDGEPYGD